MADPLPHFTRHASLPGPIADKLRSLDSIPALGAFNYTVEARDAERAVELVSRLSSGCVRARFAHSNRHIVFSSEVYVETEDRFIELRVPDRNAAIMSLVTEGQLLDVIPAKTYAQNGMPSMTRWNWRHHSTQEAGSRDLRCVGSAGGVVDRLSGQRKEGGQVGAATTRPGWSHVRGQELN